jgi:D-alanine-D-alanine ligase-like ATP-grasp enzyme
MRRAWILVAGAASAGGGTLILASVAGVVGLFATSLVGMLFPKYVEGNSRMSFVAKNAAGDWSLTKTGSIVVAGIANGLFFWALHSLAFFQGAGFFGNALAGALSLMGYAVVVQPLMGSLSKVAA